MFCSVVAACLQVVVCVLGAVYHIKNQQDATLAVLFISHCKITLRVSDASCVHHQQFIKL